MRFTIAGRRVRGEDLPLPLARWLGEEWRAEGLAEPDHPFLIELTHRPDPPHDLEEGQGRPVDPPSQEGPRWRRLGDACWIRDEERGVRWTRSRAGALIETWAPSDPSGLAATSWLAVAMAEAVRSSGLDPLHAAVAAPPGRESAVAFVGPSGSGKSTTLLAALTMGWRPLCEDTAWMAFPAGLLRANDSCLHVDARALDVLGLREHGEGGRGARKGRVPFSSFGPEPLREAPLTWVVELRREAGPARCEPLGRAIGAGLLWRGTGIPILEGERRRIAERLPDLIRRIRFLRLRFPPGPPPLSLVLDALDADFPPSHALDTLIV